MLRLMADGFAGPALRQADEPGPAPGQVGIRPECSLISAGTELHYIRRGRETGERFDLGYCTAGVVTAVGPSAPGFAPGDRVIGMGWGYAVHAERVRVPYRLCVKVADGVRLDDAVFANLAATALHAIRRSRLAPGEDVLVVGAGLVGQLVARCAAVRAGAAAVIAMDRHAGRLGRAEAAGIATLRPDPGETLAQALRRLHPRARPTKAFLCLSGDASAAFAQAAQALDSRGTAAGRSALVCVGRFRLAAEFSVELGNVDILNSARCGEGYRDDDYAHGRTNLVAPPGEATVDANLRECLDLIREGNLAPRPLNTHQVDFRDALSAYPLFDRPDEALGVTFHYP